MSKLQPASTARSSLGAAQPTQRTLLKALDMLFDTYLGTYLVRFATANCPCDDNPRRGALTRAINFPPQWGFILNRSSSSSSDSLVAHEVVGQGYLGLDLGHTFRLVLFQHGVRYAHSVNVDGCDRSIVDTRIGERVVY